MSANGLTAQKLKPLLVHGQRLTQPEFHRRYEAMPVDFKAELIGGVVHVAAAMKRDHGRYDVDLSGIFWIYETHTPGVEASSNTTAILGPWSEPQPDLALRILPEYGGLARISEARYWIGAAELIAEVSDTTIGLDLGEKKQDYELAGVLEYIVLDLQKGKLYWFDLRGGLEIKPDRRGIYRSKVFPGLWIDGRALVTRKPARLLKVIQEGVSSPQHAAFVRRLRAARRKRK
jgi:Uma2 family endonuclease